MSLRPTTLKAIAQRSDSIEDFGRHLRDWLHALRRASSRTQAVAAITDEPPRLQDKFPEGRIADAWLAAYAEHLAGKIGMAAPEWAFAPWRTADDPVFDEGSTPVLRTLALVPSPLPCPRDAVRAAVDVTGEHDHVRRNHGQFHVPELAVKVTQDTDAHFSINRTV